ncbi:MAG: sortase [bacterium]|nr:sortase [bacterium]
MAVRRKKWPIRRIWPGLTVVFVLLGAVLLVYSGLNYYHYNRSIQPAVAVEAIATPAPGPSAPVHLTIAGVLDEPLERGSYGNGRWSVSDTAGTYLVQSAKPGEPGNVIIYGHNKADIFGSLPKVTGRERVTLRLENGTERHYRIVSRETVGQDRTDLLAPTDTETLTVYTCTGWLDQDRFVVKAVPAG